MEKLIRDNAIQSSNLILQSTRNSMLHNQRNDLASMITNLGKVQYFKSIRIYNKMGRIEFTSDSTELYQVVDKDVEQCIFCHDSEHAKGTIPKENRFRETKPINGYRMLGLINPIENEPQCSNADCHAHYPNEKLLGLLDFQISLERLDRTKADVTNFAIISFILLTLVSLFVFSRIVRTQIQQPVSKLIDGTQQIAELNLDHRIDVNSSDEIGKLAEAFNFMIAKLKAARTELTEWSNKLEQRVQEKTKKLQEANKQLIMAEKLSSMGKLAAVVAHEINNPLSGILTYAKLLIRNLENSPDQQQIDDSIKNLKIIRDESKRCGDIVRNLLLFAKSSFGKRSLNTLQEIINKSVQLIQHSINLKNVTLVKEYADEDIVIECDAPAIEQMMIALLINAVEACPEKQGELVIGIRRENDMSVEISLKDNGCGIDEDLLPHIFEPFFSTKGGEHSVGLGLAVVYGIVENHYGTINVESKKGQGTTFRIFLPINLETK
ncbi:HAMP domain-containing protein [candidate division KSB1 bacterium]|nr:HAMP domain-containing protein [candidate division KSB1 bacterium]